MEDFRPYKGVIVTSHPPAMFKSGNQILTNGGALYTNRSAIYKQIETVIAQTLWNWKKRKRVAHFLCSLFYHQSGALKDDLTEWWNERQIGDMDEKTSKQKIDYKLVSILKIHLVIQWFPLFLPTFKVAIFFFNFSALRQPEIWANLELSTFKKPLTEK